MKAYRVTVQLLPVSDEGTVSIADACDAVSEVLTHNLEHNGQILDWCYTFEDGRYKDPEIVDLGPVSEWDTSNSIHNLPVVAD